MTRRREAARPLARAWESFVAGGDAAMQSPRERETLGYLKSVFYAGAWHTVIELRESIEAEALALGLAPADREALDRRLQAFDAELQAFAHRVLLESRGDGQS